MKGIKLYAVLTHSVLIALELFAMAMFVLAGLDKQVNTMLLAGILYCLAQIKGTLVVNDILTLVRARRGL